MRSGHEAVRNRVQCNPELLLVLLVPWNRNTFVFCAPISLPRPITFDTGQSIGELSFPQSQYHNKSWPTLRGSLVSMQSSKPVSVKRVLQITTPTHTPQLTTLTLDRQRKKNEALANEIFGRNKQTRGDSRSSSKVSTRTPDLASRITKVCATQTQTLKLSSPTRVQVLIVQNLLLTKLGLFSTTLVVRSEHRLGQKQYAL